MLAALVSLNLRFIIVRRQNINKCRGELVYGVSCHLYGHSKRIKSKVTMYNGDNRTQMKMTRVSL